MRSQMSGQINVEVEAKQQPDLSAIMDEVRGQYETLTANNQKELDVWFQTQVINQYPGGDINCLSNISLTGTYVTYVVIHDTNVLQCLLQSESLNKEVAVNTQSLNTFKSEISELRRTLQGLEIELQSQLSMVTEISGANRTCNLMQSQSFSFDSFLHFSIALFSSRKRPWRAP